MNKIQQTIESSEKEFDLLFPSDDENSGYRKNLNYLADLCCGSDNCTQECGSDKRRVIKSHLHLSQLNLIKAVVEHLGGMQKPIIKAILSNEIKDSIDNFEKQCRALGFNSALSSIISKLNEIK